MFFKNALAQVFLSLVLLISPATIAMNPPSARQESDPNTFSMMGTVTLVRRLLPQKSIEYCIDVNMPGSVIAAQLDQRYEKSIMDTFNQVLTAHAAAVAARMNNNRITMIPTRIHFSANTQRVTFENNLGKQQLTGNQQAILKVQVHALFNQAQSTFEDKRALVHVTFTNSEKQHVVLDLAMLNTLCSNKVTLKLTPETQRTVFRRQVALSATRQVLADNRLNASELPDPDEYLKNKHIKDVVKMVAYYMQYIDCLDVE
ncbi:MAG: hypothetical protein AB7F19_04205 [Candidatus Babeliales bacterium]